MKANLKIKAIQLRRAGRTYAEILAVVPVAKSTLSSWLRDVGLSRAQKQTITERRLSAARRGALVRKMARLQEVESFTVTGRRDVGALTDRELWLIATALYWAEGSKQNLRSPSAGIQFGNTDARMLKFFMTWLGKIKIDKSEIDYELYIHETRFDEAEMFRKWWARQLSVPIQKLDRIYKKRGKADTNRTNTGSLYHGLLRIRVRASTKLNRRINGWIEAIALAV